MIATPTPFTPLQALAGQWRVLAVMLVAFARQVSLAHKMRSEAGLHKAELLEAALYAALVQLSAEISAASQKPLRNRADKDALAYLKTVHALLGVTALMVRAFKADFALAAEQWQLLQQPADPHVRLTKSAHLTGGFLDSG